MIIVVKMLGLKFITRDRIFRGHVIKVLSEVLLSYQFEVELFCDFLHFLPNDKVLIDESSLIKRLFADGIF